MSNSFGLAGGRRARNARRALLAERRRLALVQAMRDVRVGKHGWKTELAKQIGCDRKTVERDIRIIGRQWRESQTEVAERRAEEQQDLRDRMAILVRASGYRGPLEGIANEDPQP
jgi:hypothetical protein